MKRPSLLILFFLVCSHLHAQDTIVTVRHTPNSSAQVKTVERLKTIERLETVSLGFGLGLDMGGIGASLVAYPQRNFGLFGGIGYAFAGTGLNAGLKVRLVDTQSHSRVIPFWLGMYGTNASVIVLNASHLNKMFSGPTFGLGVDLKARRQGRRTFTSFALLLPVRNSAAKEYLESFGSRVERKFWPVLISLGIRFSLDATKI